MLLPAAPLVLLRQLQMLSRVIAPSLVLLLIGQLTGWATAAADRVSC
jgi:hypothetical protein